MASSKGKQPRMKTASEVVKRLLWDDSLPQDLFVVGYIDRFLGTLERPFMEFTWGDFAAADPEDPAIPEHRIEYFKYKSRKVWEKSTKLDLVFGSLGGAKGRSIVDVMAAIDAKEEIADDDFDVQDPVSVECYTAGTLADDTVYKPKNCKYAVILQIQPTCSSEHIVSQTQDFLISDPILCDSVHRLVSQNDLHVTLCVFETNQEPKRICNILDKSLNRVTEILKDHELRIDDLCLLKGTVVAAKVSDSKLTDCADYLKQTFQGEDFAVHTLTCLHATLARFKKSSDEEIINEIEAKILEHSGFSQTINGSWIIGKKVGINEEVWRAFLTR